MKKTMFCAAALSVFSLFGAWSDGIDTAYMSSFSLDGDAEFTGISIYGGLVLSGDGTLSFSGVAPLTASGQYFGAPPVDIAVNGGGIRTYAGEIADLPDDFDAGALVHFDASLPETLVTTNDATHICKWLDARPEMRSSVYAWADNPGDNGFCKEWPTIGSGDASLPGGTFVDFGSYMEGGWETSDSSYMLYPAQDYIREGFIVLRINGGMSFFLGSSLGYTDFHRGTGGQLMTYDLDYWRANGFRVQSGVFTQNGTFKLISFALGNGYHADAMALDRYLRGGGCAVAEYLLFGEELDEERRHAIDDHLMRKWFGHGLPVDGSLAIGNLAYGDGAANEIDVAGDTSVASLAGSGVFVKKGAGALSIAAAGGIDGYDVRDGSLAIKGTVPAVFEEAFIWLDPSDETTLVTNSAGLVTQINDVRGADVNYAYRSSSSSAIVEGATLTSFGPNGMPVLDMGGYNDSTSVGFVWNRQCSDARTIFVVAARNENHGEQFLLGHESQFCFHADSGHYLCGSATGSGYWSGQAVLGATWNIDGESVANGDSLYSTAWPVGQLQVFSISGCDYDGWPAIVGQLAQDRTFRVGGLKYGEVIVFQRALAETEVKRVRDYLLEKWLGMDVDPYGAQYESLAVASGAKIFHDGALSIPDGGMLSVVAPADPDGAVEVSGSLDLGEAVTLRIDVGALETPPSGEIVVASYSGDLRGADNLAGWTVEGTAVAGRKVSLSAGNGRLVATLSPVGTVIIVR